MNQQELELILKNHRKWLLGDGGEHADLRHANLSDADLSNAYLSDADLSNAYLRGADLRNADLSNAYLRGADLSNADLRGANLRGADLSNADLRNANLRGASTQYSRGLKIISVDNIGSYNGKATFIPKYNVVYAGCWAGTLDEFLEKGEEMNIDNPTELKNIKLAYELFKNNEEVSE